MWFKGGFGVQPKSGVFKSITQLQWSSITEISISKQCSDILAQLLKISWVFFFIAITEIIEMTVQIVYFRLYLYVFLGFFFYFYFTPVISSIAHWSFKNTVL